MNKLLNAMKVQNTHATTENGGRTYTTTMSGLMDLFALGGAYRARTTADRVNLFMSAFKEDESLALKCLFYLRDVRGGQGERKFFREVTRWLAINETEAMRRNLQYVAEYGRWDDFYAFVDTPLESEAFDIMRHQLALDVSCKTPSLLAKWLKSENASSAETAKLARKTYEAFGMTPRQYRKTLSVLRGKIRIVERLMSENRWDEIEFDKIPSRAGLIYRNAFARRDIIKAKYEQFAKDKTTKVNAGALYPAEVVNKARHIDTYNLEDTERLMVNKYWDSMDDFFKDAIFDGVAVVDTSGSMTGYGNEVAPIDVAISLGMYCAEKCNQNSPWAGRYITFSRNARLVEVKGADFVDKVNRIVDANLCENTNIRSVFDLLLNLAIKNGVSPDEMPKNVIIISDMEFDYCASFNNRGGGWGWNGGSGAGNYQSEMEAIAQIWESHGYQMPKLVFWNVEARQDNIPMRDNGRVTFVSGYSPVLFQQILTGKTGIDLVLEKLNSERYEPIH